MIMPLTLCLAIQHQVHLMINKILFTFPPWLGFLSRGYDEKEVCHMNVETGNIRGTWGYWDTCFYFYKFLYKRLLFSIYFFHFFLVRVPLDDLCLPLFESLLRPWYANTSTLLCTPLYHFQVPSSAYRRFSETFPTFFALVRVCRFRIFAFELLETAYLLLAQTGVPESHDFGL